VALKHWYNTVHKNSLQWSRLFNKRNNTMCWIYVQDMCSDEN